MAQVTRFDGNVEPFAHEALGTERTVFGAETQSDALDDNINTDFFRGWGIVGVNQLPTKQDFNAFAYTSTALSTYLFQMGVPEWNTNQEYFTGSIANVAGVLYRAVQDNTGVDPTGDDGTNWVLANQLDIAGLDTATIADGDFLVFADISDSNKLKKVAKSNIITPPVFSEEFVSTAQTITSAGLLTLAHGLSAQPKQIRFRLKCLTADNGYSVDDEILVDITTSDAGITRVQGVKVDGTNINIRLTASATVFSAANFSTGSSTALTNSRWELYVHAWA